MESWQSGNAADSKSADPVHPGAQVQICTLPYEETRRTLDYIRIHISKGSYIFKCKKVEEN